MEGKAAAGTLFRSGLVARFPEFCRIFRRLSEKSQLDHVNQSVTSFWGVGILLIKKNISLFSRIVPTLIRRCADSDPPFGRL